MTKMRENDAGGMLYMYLDYLKDCEITRPNIRSRAIHEKRPSPSALCCRAKRAKKGSLGPRWEVDKQCQEYSEAKLLKNNIE
jgi:hypothetical protein